MRPSGTHLYKRFCLSVGPYVCYASWKIAVFGTFQSRHWLKTKHSLGSVETLSWYSVFLSVCLSIYPSIYLASQPPKSKLAYTQSRLIVAQSGLFFLSSAFFFPFLLRASQKHVKKVEGALWWSCVAKPMNPHIFFLLPSITFSLIEIIT